MARPEGADHREADEKPMKVGISRASALERRRGAVATLEMRRVDLDDEQGDRDREHRVGEEDQPLERMVGLA